MAGTHEEGRLGVEWLSPKERAGHQVRGAQDRESKPKGAEMGQAWGCEGLREEGWSALAGGAP